MLLLSGNLIKQYVLFSCQTFLLLEERSTWKAKLQKNVKKPIFTCFLAFFNNWFKEQKITLDIHLAQCKDPALTQAAPWGSPLVGFPGQCLQHASAIYFLVANNLGALYCCLLVLYCLLMKRRERRSWVAISSALPMKKWPCRKLPLTSLPKESGLPTMPPVKSKPPPTFLNCICFVH